MYIVLYFCVINHITLYVYMPLRNLEIYHEIFTAGNLENPISEEKSCIDMNTFFYYFIKRNICFNFLLNLK